MGDALKRGLRVGFLCKFTAIGRRCGSIRSRDRSVVNGAEGEKREREES